jgi:hypothetical protein
MNRARRRVVSAIATVGAVVVAGVGAGLGPASADSKPTDPTDPTTPTTVTADGLPTAQINGVGLTQVVLNGTVYVGGTFTTARPAGSAPGENTVRRTNLLAYDLATGVLKKAFRPNVNGTVHALAASPDGKRLYVGGSFTEVNGRVRRHIVALTPGNGTVVSSFRAGTDRAVRAIAAGSRAVWFGGDFRTVRGVSRTSLAKVRASDGAVQSWRPKATGGSVTAMVYSGSRRSIVAGGRFTAVNGSSNPGYGLVKIDALTGAMQPLPANQTIRNAGANAGITSLASDGTNFYGSAYAYRYRDGNLEGSFSARWSNGRLNWVASCHGDTYDVYPAGGVLYTVGHAHNCANIGGFPDSDPRSYHYAVAFSKAVTGTNQPEPVGSPYHSFAGQPAPSLLTWFPRFNTGTTTAAKQAAWSVKGRGRYLAVAGEFTKVNGVAQQGLVRFVGTAGAPNQQKPLGSVSGFANPTTQQSGSDVTVSWTTTWDRDNRDLTYQVYRKQIGGSGYAAIGDPQTMESNFWDPRQMSYTDTAVPDGKYRYQVRVVDPLGNQTLSQETAEVTVPAPIVPAP